MHHIPIDTSINTIVNALFDNREAMAKITFRRERSHRVPAIEKGVMKAYRIAPVVQWSMAKQVENRDQRAYKWAISDVAREEVRREWEREMALNGLIPRGDALEREDTEEIVEDVGVRGLGRIRTLHFSCLIALGGI